MTIKGYGIFGQQRSVNWKVTIKRIAPDRSPEDWLVSYLESRGIYDHLEYITFSGGDHRQINGLSNEPPSLEELKRIYGV